MQKIHMTLVLAISLLALTACGPTQEAPTTASTTPVQAQVATPPAPEATTTRQSTPTDTASPIDPCELLDRAEIQAVGFTEYDVGEPYSGIGVPLGLGEASKCQWEIGNPKAQFHERLYLYLFQLGPDETTESAYEGQLRRMQNTIPIETLGDAAAYSQTSQTLLMRDGELLIYLRADADDLTGEVDFQAGLETLAQLILERA